MADRKIKRRQSDIFDLSLSKRYRPVRESIFAEGGEVTDVGNSLGSTLTSVGNTIGGKGGNILGAAGSVVGGVTSIIDSAKKNAEIADTSGIRNEISETGNTDYSDSSSYDDLLGNWGGFTDLKNNYTMKDVRGVSGLEMVGNTISAVGSGAMAGASVGGPWGAVAGAAVGLGSSLAGIFSGNNKARKEAEALNELANEAMTSQNQNFARQAKRISKNSYNDMMANIAADGGFLSFNDSDIVNYAKDGGRIHIKPENKGKFTALKKRTGKSASWFKEHGTPAQKKMAVFALNARKWKHDDGGFLNTHGTEWDNGLTYINAGGTHSENPYDGVQIGIDNQGIPNLVEEGEVIFNDYVFSNRLSPDKKELSKIGLPEKYANHSFASAAEDIGKYTEESPNDPISKRTLEVNLGRLAEIQEKQRMKRRYNNRRMFPTGGRLNPYSNYTTLTDDSFYSTPYMRFWNRINNNRDSAEAQQLLADINAGKFGNVGGNTFTIDDILRLSHDYKKGPVHEAFNRAAAAYYRNEPVPEVEASPALTGKAVQTGEQKTIVSPAVQQQQNLSEDPDYLPTYLRYAPAVGSALQALSSILTDPDYEHADALMDAANDLRAPQVSFTPVTQKLRYNPLDRNYYLNQLRAQAGATRRAIGNSTGNAGTAIAGLLAADYNAQRNVGDTLLQMQQYNNAQKERVQTFNRATDQYNSQGFLNAGQFNASQKARRDALRLGYIDRALQMKEASDRQLEATRSANLTNFFDNLGAIGQENMGWNWTDWLARNEVFGVGADSIPGDIWRKNGGLMTKRNRRRK